MGLLRMPPQFEDTLRNPRAHLVVPFNLGRVFGAQLAGACSNNSSSCVDGIIPVTLRAGPQRHTVQIIPPRTPGQEAVL